MMAKIVYVWIYCSSNLTLFHTQISLLSARQYLHFKQMHKKIPTCFPPPLICRLGALCMGYDARVFNQVRHKPTCSATETSYNCEIMCASGRVMILFRKQKTQALIRLHGCSGWSAPLLFACNKVRVFSH